MATSRAESSKQPSFGPDDDTPVFVISVAAQLAGMHAQTLRQYDRLGLVSPSRTRGGGRRYSGRDVALLREVQRLSQEGLVYRVPGRGTFVAEPPVHRQAGHLLSFTEEMRRRGRVPTSRLLAREVREPGPAEASRLQLEPGAEVIAVRRLRVADDEPLAIE